nr:SpoIIIAC/SpoIIIAD family protein [uncultured Blautia sp.]
MDIIKISLLGVCGVILGFLMKGTKPEYACFITVGIGLVIMGLVVGKIRYLFDSLEEIQQTLPADTEYISVLVKMIGVTYIGQFASGICKDAGYGTTAAQIELFCKLSVMVLSMPVLMALLKTIQEFMV